MASLGDCRISNARRTLLQLATNRRKLVPRPSIMRCKNKIQISGIVCTSSKLVWLQTSDKAAFTVALESGGVSAFVFGPDAAQRALASAWSTLGRFVSLNLDNYGTLAEAVTGRVVGEVVAVDGPEAARNLEARLQQRRLSQATSASESSGQPHEHAWSLVLDARDWKVIPAENLVALAQPLPSSTGHPFPAVGAPPGLQLLAVASTAEEARLMLEALEAGTAGVLLRSNDPVQVRNLLTYVSRRAAEKSGDPDALLHYSVAKVVGVRQLGLGDRVCVDLAGLMQPLARLPALPSQPGEGLLVGSFARCLALVHSECGESQYIASRPFRVNAGPVHAYVLCPDGRTRYLSELASGMEVVVADPAGRCRTAVVGRVKIERRPLVLVELATPAELKGKVDGAGEVTQHSLMLQNAETVKLVGPPRGHASWAGPKRVEEREGDVDAACSGVSGVDVAWCAISVSELQPGDLVNVLLQPPARHTGIAVEEFILEK
ncbi:hypothetical protein VaNZ11_007446 [Volvox africanus]|uniref:3-dehydroquinate synthase n=1 Tax=Volvox africanus TaxID=51714 RepID=A0ABQ5S2W3_9CHLO|nr:hypothetical protein VaNZ11_007446 [Volvox africanus]